MAGRAVSDAVSARPPRFRTRLRLSPLVTVLLLGCVGFAPAPAPAQRNDALRLPPGFSIDVFAKDLERVRFLAIDPRGTLVASIPRSGQVVALPDADGNGRAERAVTVIDGLDLPHGLAFHDGALYIAETGRVIRVRYDPATLRAGGAPEVVVPNIPARGAHWTRTIAFGPDNRLYMSAGSSCNNCEERDSRRAAITRYNADGSGETRFATGLRNAVGIAFRPGTGELWATVNGRDWLGDNLPAEYVTRVEERGFYGWPYCYWVDGRVVVDPDLGSPERCRAVARPTVLHQAHSAPLGMAFYTGSQFPAEYRGSLLVALHGSWNRSQPTGYKVIRVRLDGGAPQVEDFVTGWLIGGQAWGRPVDVAVARDGSLFLSDDAQGVIYRISYRER